MAPAMKVLRLMSPAIRARSSRSSVLFLSITFVLHGVLMGGPGISALLGMLIPVGAAARTAGAAFLPANAYSERVGLVRGLDGDPFELGELVDHGKAGAV